MTTVVEDLLIDAANNQDDRARNDRFVAALMDAPVIVLEYNQAQPFVLGDDRGPVLPVFTSNEAVQTARPEIIRLAGPELELVPALYKCRDLWSQAVSRQTRVILNMFNPYGREFYIGEMSDLLAGRNPGTRERTIEETTPVAVGVPAQIPDGMIDMLANLMSTKPKVQEARLAWIQYPDGMQGYMLIIDAPGATRDEVLPGIDDVVPLLPKGTTMDTMLSRRDDFGAHVQPFYVKGIVSA